MSMKKNDIRHDGRTAYQMRPVSCLWNHYSYAPGAVIIEWGNTKVLCAVTMQSGVPPFLRGKGQGWLTAEYMLLPTATPARIARDVSACKRNGRAVEISRLIGRVLRTIIDFSALAERTIYIDCDVLQADGGTRVAAITGASLALLQAQNQWLAEGILEKPFLKDSVAAIAVGVYHGAVILDPDYHEDTDIDADFNVVMTISGKVIEIQGGAEKDPLCWEQFEQIRLVACNGIQGLKSLFESVPSVKLSSNPIKKEHQAENKRSNTQGQKYDQSQGSARKSSIFSLEFRSKEQAV